MADLHEVYLDFSANVPWAGQVTLDPGGAVGFYQMAVNDTNYNTVAAALGSDLWSSIFGLSWSNDGTWNRTLVSGDVDNLTIQREDGAISGVVVRFVGGAQPTMHEMELAGNAAHKAELIGAVGQTCYDLLLAAEPLPPPDE